RPEARILYRPPSLAPQTYGFAGLFRPQRQAVPQPCPRMRRAARPRRGGLDPRCSLAERFFHGAEEARIVGGDAGNEASVDAAVAGDQELLEVPQDVGGVVLADAVARE